MALSARQLLHVAAALDEYARIKNAHALFIRAGEEDCHEDVFPTDHTRDAREVIVKHLDIPPQEPHLIPPCQPFALPPPAALAHQIPDKDWIRCPSGLKKTSRTRQTSSTTSPLRPKTIRSTTREAKFKVATTTPSAQEAATYIHRRDTSRHDPRTVSRTRTSTRRRRLLTQSVQAPNKPDVGDEVQNTPNSQSNG